MSKVSLANSVAEVLNISHDKADYYVSIVIDSIKQGIAKQGKVVVRGFGVFKARGKAKRMGRNPKTGKSAVITARRVVKFSPSRLFKARLNTF